MGYVLVLHKWDEKEQLVPFASRRGSGGRSRAAPWPGTGRRSTSCWGRRTTAKLARGRGSGYGGCRAGRTLRFFHRRSPGERSERQLGSPCPGVALWTSRQGLCRLGSALLLGGTPAPCQQQLPCRGHGQALAMGQSCPQHQSQHTQHHSAAPHVPQRHAPLLSLHIYTDNYRQAGGAPATRETAAAARRARLPRDWGWAQPSGAERRTSCSLAMLGSGVNGGVRNKAISNHLLHVTRET